MTIDAFKAPKAASGNKFPEFGSTWNCGSRSDRVIPCWTDGMMLDIERLHLGITDRHPCGIVAGLEVGLYGETGRRGGAADERQQCVPGA